MPAIAIAAITKTVAKFGFDADTLDRLSISKKADIALKMKRREVLAFGLEVQRGKYQRVEQCQRDRLPAIDDIKQGLPDLAKSGPGSPEVKAILSRRVLKLLRRFSKGGG